MLMERQGYTATTANSSEEADRILAKEPFDLMLCDLSLEKQKSGFEVIDAAKKQYPAMPAVLITGYATQIAVEEAGKRGVKVLFKPIEIPELLTTIAELLRDGNGESSNQVKKAGSN